MDPGFYNLDEQQYHQDPTQDPSLSASIAHTLLNKSPRHAWEEHPRLNPEWQERRDTKFSIGNAAHGFLLRGRASVTIIDADNYRTKAAQEQRDAAWDDGKTPLLKREYSAVNEMILAARAQLAEHDEATQAFSNGTPEQTMIWREGDVWCRGRLDWLPDTKHGHVTLYDYKTTSGSAHPDAVQSRLYETGADLQAAFYSRGFHAITGCDTVTFLFVVQETRRPYALSVVGLAPDAIALANDKVRRALALWQDCIENDHWPAYPRRVCWIDAPSWKLQQWEDEKARAEE